jgi:hypothetical protein
VDEIKIAYKIYGWKTSKESTTIWRNIRNKLKALNQFRVSYPNIDLISATVRGFLEHLTVIRLCRI